MKVSENSRKLWKHSPAARVPTAFFVLPNFHSCLHNSIETRYMFSISEIQYANLRTIFTIQYPVPLFSLCTKSLIAVLKDAKQLSEENGGGPFC